jgi:hypothetical protein
MCETTGTFTQRTKFNLARVLNTSGDSTNSQHELPNNALQVTVPEGKGGYNGSGSLVKFLEQVVGVTSAHVFFDEKTKKFLAEVQSTRVYHQALSEYHEDDASCCLLGWTQIWIHPGYDPGKEGNDVAVIFFRDGFGKLDELCLPKLSPTNAVALAGRSLSGRGFIHDDNNKLRSIVVKAECAGNETTVPGCAFLNSNVSPAGFSGLGLQDSNGHTVAIVATSHDP